jgi:hypothetical protein
MIEKRVDNAGLERIYDAIAEAIDVAGEAKRALFLAKLSLALANLVADPAAVERAIAASLRDL